MEKLYYVYKHTFPNGKVYIGITSQDLYKRWRNGNGYKGCTLMHKAIQKYGWENIKHEILFSGLTKQQAEQKEIELISYYNSTNKEFGYNIENGGNTIGTHAEQTKKKIADFNKGRVLPLETRKKISEKHKGVFTESQRENHWSKTGTYKPVSGYYHHSTETKNKLKEFRNKNKDKYNKQVLQIDKLTGQVIATFESASLAGAELEIDRSCISKVCRGERATAGGYRWEYLNEYKKEKDVA